MNKISLISIIAFSCLISEQILIQNYCEASCNHHIYNFFLIKEHILRRDLNELVNLNFQAYTEADTVLFIQASSTFKQCNDQNYPGFCFNFHGQQRCICASTVNGGRCAHCSGGLQTARVRPISFCFPIFLLFFAVSLHRLIFFYTYYTMLPVLVVFSHSRQSFETISNVQATTTSHSQNVCNLPVRISALPTLIF